MTLRIGAVGCGSIAWRNMLPAIEEASGVRLVAVASRTQDKARRFADRFGCDPVVDYARLLERDDVDAIYIALPTGMHTEWIRAGLDAGKHVLCEKPLSASADDARTVTAIARERGLLLMENFMWLHHSQHAAVRKLVADGAIGSLRLFSAVFGIPPLPAGDIRYSTELGGGALLDLGAHTLRAAQLFCGDDLAVSGAHLRRDPETGVDIVGSALLTTPDGVLAQLSFAMDTAYRSAYTLWGTDGRIVLERAFTPPPSWRPIVRIERQDNREERTLPGDNHFKNIIEHFAAVVTANAGFGRYADEIVRQAALLESIRDCAKVSEPTGEKVPCVS